MTTLVVGATGATGRLLVRELLERGEHVRIIVRSIENLHEKIESHDNLSVVCASVSDLSDAEVSQHIGGCDAVASCLGHNQSFKGMFGNPRRLVTETTQRLCSSVQAVPMADVARRPAESKARTSPHGRAAGSQPVS